MISFKKEDPIEFVPDMSISRRAVCSNQSSDEGDDVQTNQMNLPPRVCQGSTTSENFTDAGGMADMKAESHHRAICEVHVPDLHGDPLKWIGLDPAIASSSNHENGHDMSPTLRTALFSVSRSVSGL